MRTLYVLELGNRCDRGLEERPAKILVIAVACQLSLGNLGSSVVGIEPGLSPKEVIHVALRVPQRKYAERIGTIQIYVEFCAGHVSLREVNERGAVRARLM